MSFNSFHSGNKFSLSEPKHEYRNSSAKKDLTAEKGSNMMYLGHLMLPKQWHLPSFNGFHFTFFLGYIYKDKEGERTCIIQ